MVLKTFLLTLISLMSVNFIFSQEVTTNKDNSIIFDNIVGLENTNIFNGKRYYNAYRTTANNTNFFKFTDYIKGNVIYNNQPFFDLDLKYDVTTDQLITKLTGDKGYINIELVKNKVNRFQIDKHHFINSKFLLKDSAIDLGFLELVHTSENYTFLIKRDKKVSKKLDNRQYVFTFKSDDVYYFFFEDKLYEISSYKELRKIIPDLKKDIDGFYRNNKKLLKSDEELFFVNLLKQLEYKKLNK